jgi:(2S)-methylsuccinyl-CoA dehydrogenase
MSASGQGEAGSGPVLANLVPLLLAASGAATSFVSAARAPVAARLVGRNGKVDSRLAGQEQHTVHGLGWYASYVTLLQEVAGWAGRLEAEGELREIDALLAQLLFAEYAAQLSGGIPMNQGEVIRPLELAGNTRALEVLQAPALEELRRGGTQAVKTAVAGYLVQGRGQATLENTGLGETFDLVREQFFAFSRDKVAPFAHQWHLADELIPMPLVQELGELGVFGITIPEDSGGLGMGKTAMCVVSEELSRGWIGVGSLATRSEIAAELITANGTPEQRRAWLPGMAKLIGARVAWAAADNCLQIHGGNGFATEYVASRLLADARILNIFEGAGEIQAQVVDRCLLEEMN